MLWQRLLLLAVIAACVYDLLRTRQIARLYPEPLTILVAANDASYSIDGFVRYLQWEFGVANRLLAEIAIEIDEDQGGECARVAKLLLADGVTVEHTSAEPALVFFIQADSSAVG